MADYASRMQEEILKHLSEKAERKTENLVVNTTMPDPQVHYHRGGIAEIRDMIIFITKELPKILNKG